jgi:purine-nucleoside phosphorylase
MRVGNIVSSDTFYSAEGQSLSDLWKRMGALAVEMEGAALYANAAYAGKRALCICTISDHIYRPEDNLSAEDRQSSFTQMMEIALDTAIAMEALS